MPGGIKKKIFHLLCNDTTGRVIRSIYRDKIPDIRWKGFQFNLSGSMISNTMAASIFWGFYESAEIRLIEKYFPGNTDVIELGGSMGIVTSHIARKLKPGHDLISIEGNPFLISTIDRNANHHRSAGTSVSVINCAIASDAARVIFNISDDNTASGVNHSAQDKGLEVPAMSLSKIVSSHSLKRYTLVCDIEGSEAEIIFKDPRSLDDCIALFIELHDTYLDGVARTKQDMIRELKNSCGFILSENQGNVFYFVRDGKSISG
jgi:FkbM family methyltransferase